MVKKGDVWASKIYEDLYIVIDVLEDHNSVLFEDVDGNIFDDTITNFEENNDFIGTTFESQTTATQALERIEMGLGIDPGYYDLHDEFLFLKKVAKEYDEKNSDKIGVL